MDLLERTVEMQYGIIDGRSLDLVLGGETKSLKKLSGANIIAVAMGEEDHLSIDMIMDEKGIFLSMLSKYGLRPKNIFLNKAMRNCANHYENGRSYLIVNSLRKIFDGTFTKIKSLEFEDEMDFHEAFVFPIRSKDDKRIGFILYVFNSAKTPNLVNMADLTVLFENLIRPFYDGELKTLRSKCVRVDNQMDILTDKEKQVASQILRAKAYKDIALDLKITINTVKTHTKSIFNKYGVGSKIELQNKLMGNS